MSMNLPLIIRRSVGYSNVLLSIPNLTFGNVDCSLVWLPILTGLEDQGDLLFGTEETIVFVRGTVYILTPRIL